MRLVNRYSPASVGLAIGYGIPAAAGLGIREALPNWGIVLSDRAAEILSTAKLQEARRLARCDASTPLLLIGYGPAGVQTVFSSFLVNATEAIVGAAFFDGEWPAEADEYRLGVLRAMAARSAADHAPRLLVDGPKLAHYLTEALGTVPAHRESPPDESLGARLSRLLSRSFGSGSKPLPAPEAP